MDKTVIALLPRQQGKLIAMQQLLEEIAPVVVIDADTGTHVTPIEDRRHVITFEIKNYRDPDVAQHEIVKKENPYKNGMLRKKGKGGFKKY